METLPEIPLDTIESAEFDKVADFYIGRAKEIRQRYKDKSNMDDAPELPYFITLGNLLVKRTNNGTSGDLRRACEFFGAMVYHPHDYVDGKQWSKTALNALNTLKPTLPNDDMTKRTEAQIHLYWSYHHKDDDPDSVFTYYSHVLDSAQTLKDTYLQVLAYMGMGYVYHIEKDAEKSVMAYEEALSLCRANGYRLLEASCLLFLGTTWFNAKHYQRAVACYRNAITINQALGNIGQVALAHYYLGLVWKDAHHPETAIEHFQKAKILYEAIAPKAKKQFIELLLRLGVLQKKAGQPQEALASIEKAQTLYADLGDTSADKEMALVLSTIWADLHESEKAISLAQEALTGFRADGNKDREEKMLYHLGNIYLAQNDYAQAVNYYEQGLVLKRELVEELYIIDYLMKLGETHHKLGNLNKALVYYEEAVVMFKYAHLSKGIKTCYTAMSEIYEALGKPETAREYAQMTKSPHWVKAMQGIMAKVFNKKWLRFFTPIK